MARVRAALALLMIAACAHPHAAPPPVDNDHPAATAPPPAPKLFVDLEPTDGPVHGAMVDAFGADPAFTMTARGHLPAFHVSVTASHDIQKHGRGITVTCTISVIVATYPSKSMFALLSGAASIPAERDAELIARAADDCIAAAVYNIIEKQVRPALRSKVGLDGVDSSE